ncbi:MAG: IS701 family transposase [Chloroflexi bacterium]|nr:IS701 family transposase [Chloroflexota bacterium]
MLPECRQSDYLFQVPKFEIKANDVENFTNEFNGYHDIFHDCFQRTESREHFYRYMAGQFLELERKSIEPIALKVKNGNVRAMQRFVSDAWWDDDQILSKYRNEVNNDMGDQDGVLIFDESGFQKKGTDSVGVSRQYCGSIGKVDNCQVGVFAAYASPNGYALIDKRLFIPEKWFTDEYEERRNKCKMPVDMTFKTKPQLARDMFLDIKEEGVLPFKYVTADTIYGSSPDFIDTLEYLPDVTYFVSLPGDSLCWLKMPATVEKKYKYRGKEKTKKILKKKNEKKPVPLSQLAETTNDYFWYKRKVSEGAKGPIEYEFSKRRVVLSKDGLPDKTVWLVLKRTISNDPTYYYYVSNALSSTRLETFVWLSGIRWAIEQCFEETKSELGMDHYEVRKYRGWNHHILTCMLGHFFLWHLKIKLGEKNTSYYAIAA